jgi:4a-hydroxytetrahydrobiopterin dehydratase
MNQTCDLSKKHCIPCRGGVPPLKGKDLEQLQQQLGPTWKVVNEHHLQKEYLFPDFKTALAFTNKVGEIAEQEDHHPDIHLSYSKVTLVIWTHKIDGLTESDFILAAKCDKAF